MKTKHTPGPWEIKIHEDGPYFTEVEVWHQNYGMIAKLPNDSSIWNSDKNEEIARVALAQTIDNANVIAAAPELLQECISMIKQIDFDYPEITDDSYLVKISPEFIDSYKCMKVAIQKAKP